MNTSAMATQWPLTKSLEAARRSDCAAPRWKENSPKCACASILAVFTASGRGFLETLRVGNASDWPCPRSDKENSRARPAVGIAILQSARSTDSVSRVRAASKGPRVGMQSLSTWSPESGSKVPPKTDEQCGAPSRGTRLGLEQRGASLAVPVTFVAGPEDLDILALAACTRVQGLEAAG